MQFSNKKGVTDS